MKHYLQVFRHLTHALAATCVHVVQAILHLPALQLLSQQPLTSGSLDWFQHTTAQQHTATHKQHIDSHQAIAIPSVQQQAHYHPPHEPQQQHTTVQQNTAAYEQHTDSRQAIAVSPPQQQEHHPQHQQQEQQQRQELSTQPVAAAELGCVQSCSQLTMQLQTDLHIAEAISQQTGNSPSMPLTAGRQSSQPCRGPQGCMPIVSQLSANSSAQLLPQVPQQQQQCRKVTTLPEGLHEQQQQQQQHYEEACELHSSASNQAQHCCPAAAAAAPRAPNVVPATTPTPTATTDDLSALALIITAAKVLFCGGALSAAQQLLQWCEAAEEAAAAAHRPLHHSSVRNEAAYARLLRKLLLDVPPPLCRNDLSLKEICRVLYVCGDSHVLPRK
jgi:hypothetical protein